MEEKNDPALNMIKISEGNSQLKILSVIAEYQVSNQYDNGPRQTDITHKLTLTKGSVSNNCNELEENGVIFNHEKNYYINKDVVLKTYIEYIENLLTRESSIEQYDSYINTSNDVRTRVRNNLYDWIGLIEDKLFNIILNILMDSRKQKSILNLREVFEKTNQSIRLLCEVDINLDGQELNIFKKIGVATKVHYKYLSDNYKGRG